MQKLEKLSIEQSHIATIRNDFHYGLESLSYITYNFGGIQEHFHLILHGNKSTRAAILLILNRLKLKLWFVSLSKNIESGAFNGLENLKELYMRENEIRSLPENLFGTELTFV